MPRPPMYPEPVLASVIGMAVGGAAGLGLAATGLGAPMVAVGLVLGLAVGSSIDAARAKRRRAADEPSGADRHARSGSLAAR